MRCSECAVIVALFVASVVPVNVRDNKRLQPEYLIKNQARSHPRVSRRVIVDFVRETSCTDEDQMGDRYEVEQSFTAGRVPDRPSGGQTDI